jgi:hypothetical protein
VQMFSVEGNVIALPTAGKRSFKCLVESKIGQKSDGNQSNPMTGMCRALYLFRRVSLPMRLSSKLFAISIPLLLILSGTALADTCNAFASYTCAKGVHDGAFIGGSGSAIGSPGAGLLLNSNMFTVSTHNGTGGADVIILAASATPLTGTLNGSAFTSLSSFPEGGATGAIVTNLQQTGFCGSCTASTLFFGYVDLGTALPANGSITVTASGVGAGTALYAEVLNSQGQIIFITANSNSGVTGGTSTVPEPGTISLMITGLCGMAGGAWRKLRG